MFTKTQNNTFNYFESLVCCIAKQDASTPAIAASALTIEGEDHVDSDHIHNTEEFLDSVSGNAFLDQISLSRPTILQDIGMDLHNIHVNSLNICFGTYKGHFIPSYSEIGRSASILEQNTTSRL